MVSSMQLLEESPANLLDEPLLAGLSPSLGLRASSDGDYDFEDDVEGDDDEDKEDDDEEDDDDDEKEDDDEDDDDRDLWDDKDEDDE